MLPSENCDECWYSRDLIGFLIENCGANEILYSSDSPRSQTHKVVLNAGSEERAEITEDATLRQIRKKRYPGED
ncbi:hypothetical protein RN001_009090 [Aquatica leii]|uniref:Uncharacterized protein n=1 Tax=Aquatica leii TaxID=1421715 RepID=A0AAN7SFH4_9COLE|nr:hypothetical protein RN001_009090 [Aquatica leii]